MRFTSKSGREIICNLKFSKVNFLRKGTSGAQSQEEDSSVKLRGILSLLGWLQTVTRILSIFCQFRLHSAHVLFIPRFSAASRWCFIQDRLSKSLSNRQMSPWPLSSLLFYFITWKKHLNPYEMEKLSLYRKGQ